MQRLKPGEQTVKAKPSISQERFERLPKNVQQGFIDWNTVSNWDKKYLKNVKYDDVSGWDKSAFRKQGEGYDEHIPKHVRQVFKDNPDAGAVIDTVSAFQALKTAMGKFKTAYRNFKTYTGKTHASTLNAGKTHASNITLKMFYPGKDYSGGYYRYNRFNTGTKPQKIKHFPAERKNN